MITVALVGLGYWGPNLLRNLVSLEGVRVAVLCDADRKRGVNRPKAPHHYSDWAARACFAFRAATCCLYSSSVRL